MKFFNRVRQLTGTVGDGDTITLGSAFSDAFLTLAEAGGAENDETVLVVEEGDDFGLYRVTVGSAAGTVEIDSVLKSKIGGTPGTTKLTLAGAAIVRFCESAEDLNGILADLASIADVLDDLGDAAFKDTGTSAGTVAAGDDSRLDWAGTVNAATGKTTPVDADLLGLVDSAASNVLKKLTWANLKATLKTYFDTLYQPVSSVLTALVSAFTPASASGPASIALAEDTDNGSHKITLTAPASIASDKTVTLQDASGTVYVSGGTNVAIADGGHGQDTATAGFDALAPTTTRGDIIIRGSSNNVRLAKGTSGHVLTMGADEPAWAAASGFPSGTLMLFQQTSAPTGWTKQTTHNDKALRVVSGTASSGGTSAFSTVFGKTATDATTISTSTMPAHTHTQATYEGGGSDGVSVGGTAFNSNKTSSSTGSGGSHTHGMDIRVQYVDLIIASKD